MGATGPRWADWLERALRKVQEWIDRYRRRRE
jgi:hypothetical protein